MNRPWWRRPGRSTGSGLLRVDRKWAIAHFVRQTRTMIYDKIDAAKIFFTRFPLEIELFGRIPRAGVRQTRTRSGAMERPSLASESAKGDQSGEGRRTDAKEAKQTDGESRQQERKQMQNEPTARTREGNS